MNGDINLTLGHLGLSGGKNRWRLNRNSPLPHTIISWKGEDPQPTDSELQTAWDQYLIENPNWNQPPDSAE